MKRFLSLKPAYQVSIALVAGHLLRSGTGPRPRSVGRRRPRGFSCRGFQTQPIHLFATLAAGSSCAPRLELQSRQHSAQGNWANLLRFLTHSTSHVARFRLFCCSATLAPLSTVTGPAQPSALALASRPAGLSADMPMTLNLEEPITAAPISLFPFSTSLALPRLSTPTSLKANIDMACSCSGVSARSLWRRASRNW